MRLFSRSIPFLARATPSGGGPVPTFVQRSAVANGEFVDATASFGSAVTAGNSLIFFGSSQGADATFSTSQTDTLTTNQFEQWGGSRVILGYANNAVGGTTTVTATTGAAGTVRFYVEEWANIELDSAGVGQTTPATFTAVTATTPSSSTVADAVSFSSWAIRSGVTQPGSGIATGFTEGGRYVGPNTNAQFVGGYRIETATGVKSAAWPDPSGGVEGQGAIIVVFRAV